MEGLTWGVEFNAWLQTFRGPLLDGLVKVVSLLGREEFYLLLIPLVYWCIDRRMGVRVGLLFLVSAYVNVGLKSLFASPRPFQVAPDRVKALVATRSYGFPSGHAQGAATVWGYLAARVGGWLWVVGIGAPLAIGVSRMYLGVHSPADVLGGWTLGAGLAAAGVWGASGAERLWARTGMSLRLAGAVAVPVALAAAHPTGLAADVTAAMAGAAAGIVLERRYVHFSARGASWRRAVRFLLGAAALVALYLGLTVVLPGEELVGRTFATALSSARYFLAAFWILFAGPLLFVSTRLAERELPDEGAAVPGRGRWTIRLCAIEDADAGLVGTKALSLARMMRMGLPVPPGFCVTGVAYREHLDSTSLAERIGSLLDERGNRESTARRRALQEVRSAIIETPLSKELAREIDSRYRALRARHVAIRSSATAEDLPGHSFAGQYDTFLGMTGISCCLDAVRRCWASVWTERAFEYRERNNIDHRTADMAVIVQELVPAEASGVLFTADPVTGQADRLVIESCFGLGETLVSGKVTPDRSALSKRRLRILEHTVATKAVETTLCPTGGVREQAVPPDRATLPSLSAAAARRLGKLALRVEQAFGSPQDVEWAAVAGRLYVIQSRPITTLEDARRRWLEDRQVWTNANSGEVIPDVVTPFTWSFVEAFLTNVFRLLYAAFGIDLGDSPPAGLIAGRVYFNVTTLMGTASGLPCVRISDSEMIKVLGGSTVALDALERILKAGALPVRRCGLRFALRLPRLVPWLLWHSPRRALSLIAGIGRKSDEFRCLDLAQLPPGEIVRLVRSTAERLCGSPDGLVYPMVAMANFMLLDRGCRRWFDDPHGTIARRLVTGLAGMQPAEAGLAMWRLAALARERPQVAKVLASPLRWEAVRGRVAALPGGKEFLCRWDEFMREHGHHTRGELEFANPRWRERPDEVLGTVRGYLASIGATDPVASQKRLAASRLALAKECRRSIRNPLTRVVFEYLLARAQLGAVIRENIKSEAVRLLTETRRMLLELGARLVGSGALDRREDVFFLRIEELEPALGAEAGLDVRETVNVRRSEYERNLAITPPSVVVGRFDPNHYVPDPVDGAATTFEGLASSAGVVTGPARVVLRAGEDTVRPGEILVAPFTDPGWTPFFVNAAGIVMDMGGLLSHGSIIAREYGIPAVVNVGPATKIIKTGQMLQVDGDRGRVSILAAGDQNGP